MAVGDNYRLILSALHGELAAATLFDLDGVLTPEICYNEPDVSSYAELQAKHLGSPYWVHLHSAPPFLIPSQPILGVASGRMHFYKAQTEAWLTRYDVRLIRGLYLSPYDRPGKRPGRSQCGNTACLKVGAFQAAAARLFIESKRWQAEQIYEQTHKPVFCMQNMRLYGTIHF